MLTKFARFFFVFILLEGSLLAHKVNLYAYAENGFVYAEAYFNDGKRVAGATVEVYDPEGKKIQSGETDSQGRWSFSIPRCTELKLVLIASAGHRGEYTLSQDEVCAALGINKRNSSAESISSADSASERTATEEKHYTYDDLKSLMEKLTRIEAKLDRPDFRDILGGLGYILGIFGLWAYLKSKR